MISVAVVGTGIMGRGMARNLLAAGHHVVVWNRTAARADELVADGAQRADSPADAASRADVVFEVTADDSSSRAAWLGADGILAGARDGAVLVTSATLSTRWVEELAAESARSGRDFLDMPVTGGRTGAEKGELVMLAGGDAATLSRVRDVLGAISRQVLHLGDVGAGTRFKLVLNALQAVHLAAFGEAMRLAEAVGLDPMVVGPALVERPGGVITGVAWESMRRAPEPITFSAAWAHKDLSYAASMAGTRAHPFLAAALDAFTAAVDAGHGDADWSVVNRR
jgi:3-hydroxyisobutyrate dehydrogenase-like beta-hydroxyacid dehydrogenase